MFFFFDGATATALSLLVALILGTYAQTRPDWWILTNEAPATIIAVTLSTVFITGCITAWAACVEYGLPVLPWMTLYVAIQAVTVTVFTVARRLIAGRNTATI